ncbi:hypothetical protein MHU86_6668 [Fragilaria crotonensis]|nr:hypothetical protein MHU86_6668 [Fragilaria crotonensis]
MKLLATSLLVLFCHSEAFTPIPKSFVVSNVGSVPRFTSLGMADLNELSLEEEVELLTQEEITKVKRASNLRNANGVDYAPWMGISEEDENRIKQMMKERASARRKRQEQEKDVSGALFSDSQAQELSGTGLKTKVIDGAVELEWATNSEKDTKGFLVKRRPTKTSEFQIVGSYKDWGPLQTKGPEGGVYRFLDTSAAPGSWVYRISEVDLDGKENDVCQCLVDVQTEEEQRGAVIAAVGISVVAILSVIAGVLLDPMDGF